MFPVFIVPFLCVLFYQEVRYKMISPLFFVLLLGYFVWNSLAEIVLEDYILNTSINLCFCLLLYAVLRMLLNAKSAVCQYVGTSFLSAWHVLFSFMLCFAFPPLTFLVYFGVNTLLVYGIHFIYQIQSKTKPVRGIHIAVLILWCSTVVFGGHQSLYDDAWVTDLLSLT
jgi:hypothetical protein